MKQGGFGLGGMGKTAGFGSGGGLPIVHAAAAIALAGIQVAGVAKSVTRAAAAASVAGVQLAAAGIAAWSPSRLTPDLWLRADQYDGAGAWTDLSANGYHATPQVVPHNPTLVTNVINGKSVVRFAVNQSLLLPSAARFTGPSGVASTEHACSFWAVSKTTAIAGYAALCILGSFGVYARLTTSGKWGCYATGQRPSANDDSSAYKQLLVLSPGSSADSTYRTNGSAETIAQGTRDNAGAFIGSDGTAGADNMSGDIAEIIMVRRILTASEITALEAYGAFSYGL